MNTDSVFDLVSFTFGELFVEFLGYLVDSDIQLGVFSV